jgi:NodT family efflux transporter outer membrane factor (OMF) lipoprotein
MNKFTHAFVLTSALMLSACSNGPDYKKPQLDLPKAFKGWKLASPKEITLQDDWYKIYKDERLDALMKQVDVSNQTLAKDLANYHYASAIIDATSAQSSPTVGAGVSASTSKSTLSSQTSGSKTTKSVDASLQASWMPDIWGVIKRQVEMSKANAESSKADLAAARLSIQILLAQSYFQLCADDTQTALLNKILKDDEQSLHILQNQYDAGIIVQTELISAKQLVESIKAQLKEVAIQRAQLEHSIGVLTGNNPSEFTLEKKALHVSTLPLPSIVPSELLERRPDIASAERKMRAANAQIGIADAAWYPQIALSASIGAQNDTLSNLISTPNLIWAVGGSLTQSIFDGGAKEANKKQAKAVYEASIASYKQTILMAFLQVEDSLSTLKNLEEELAIQKNKTEFSSQIYKISQNQYNAGIINYINTINAKTALYNDMLMEVEIQSRLLATHAAFVGSLGGDAESLQLDKKASQS